jgi:hypothetical protein
MFLAHLPCNGCLGDYSGFMVLHCYEFLVKKILMLYHISETLYTFAEVKSMTYEIRNIQYTFLVDIKEQRHKTQ